MINSVGNTSSPPPIVSSAVGAGAGITGGVVAGLAADRFQTVVAAAPTFRAGVGPAALAVAMGLGGVSALLLGLDAIGEQANRALDD